MAKLSFDSSVSTKKKKKKKITSITVRENKKIDLSPNWDDHEELETDQFLKRFFDATQYYNLSYSAKDLKPKVLEWMDLNNFDKKTIQAFKKTKDWRCTSTLGTIACCLMKGMPDSRPDFRNGDSVSLWLTNRINNVISDGLNDSSDDPQPEEVVAKPAIQERTRDIAIKMALDIDDALEVFFSNPSKFDPKNYKVLNILKGNNVKAGHAKIIKSFYEKEYLDLDNMLSSEPDEQIKESYKHLSKVQIRTIFSFYKEINDACDMLVQESKVNKAPRAKKPLDKDKLISKLKYKKSDNILKLVSINPIDLIDSKEIWVFNTKTRKLGKYIAETMSTMTIKGSCIIGFNEVSSIQKTIRKPDEKLKEFNSANKVALRKFLDEINAVDTKLNGRINEDTILLKVIR